MCIGLLIYHTIFCFNWKIRLPPALLPLHRIHTCAETFPAAGLVLQWRVPWQESLLLPDDTSILSFAYQSHLTSRWLQLTKHALSGVNQGQKTNLWWSQTSEPDFLSLIRTFLSVVAVHIKVASNEGSSDIPAEGWDQGTWDAGSPAAMDQRLVTAPSPEHRAGVALAQPALAGSELGLGGPCWGCTPGSSPADF